MISDSVELYGIKLPRKIECNGGTLNYCGVSNYGRALYDGSVKNAFVYIGFDVISSTKGEALDVFIGNNLAELEDEGFLDPLTGTEGEFNLSEIPDYVESGIAWMNDRGHLKPVRSRSVAPKKKKPAEDGRIHLSWGKVSDLFYEYNKLIDWNDYKAAIVAYVVYSNDTQSWRRHDYSLESRTYAFGSNNKAFIPGMGGYSIFAQNLDKTDFTRIEHVDWIVEDVYLEKSEYDRMMKIINAGTRVKTQSKSKKPVRKTTTKRSVKK